MRELYVYTNDHVEAKEQEERKSGMCVHVCEKEREVKKRKLSIIHRCEKRGRARDTRQM